MAPGISNTSSQLYAKGKSATKVDLDEKSLAPTNVKHQKAEVKD